MPPCETAICVATEVVRTAKTGYAAVFTSCVMMPCALRGGLAPSVVPNSMSHAFAVLLFCEVEAHTAVGGGSAFSVNPDPATMPVPLLTVNEPVPTVAITGGVAVGMKAPATSAVSTSGIPAMRPVVSAQVIVVPPAVVVQFVSVFANAVRFMLGFVIVVEKFASA